MAKFVDATGHEWAVVITYDTLFRAKKAGHDLPAKMEGLDKLAEDLADPLKFFELLLVVCQPEAAGVASEEFAKRLDGDAAHAAVVAIQEAAVDFFPLLSKAEKAAAKGLRQRAQERRQEQLVRHLDSWNSDTASAAPPG